MKIVNLTPHAITVQLARTINGGFLGESRITFDSAGNCRVAVKQTRADTLGYDVGSETLQIPVVENEYGEVEGLPEPQEGVVYLVSLLALSAIRMKGLNRLDVFAPDSGPSAIRKNGQLIAVRNFVRQ